MRVRRQPGRASQPAPAVAPGSPWEGPVAYCMDAPMDVPVHGYYALDDDGKGFRQPLLRVVCVDDAPGDAEDGACHYEVAGPNDPPQKPSERIVSLEAHAEGSTGVES